MTSTLELKKNKNPYDVLDEIKKKTQEDETVI
jgi:hypothetical protein